MINFLKNVYFNTLGRLIKYYSFKRRLRQMKKNDPFIY